MKWAYDVSTPERFSRRYWRRLALFTVMVSSLGAIFTVLYLGYLQLEAFVTPHRNLYVGSLEELGRPYETVTLTTADGLEIAGWYIPGRRAEAIILVHGIDANRSAVLPEATMLAEAGYHLLLIDLRGHGLSQDSDATYGYREALDVQAAVDYLAALPQVEQIGALGTSFGGAAVVRAAALDPRLRAIVVESSYSSLPDAIEDAFDNRSIFPRWPFAPVFIALTERRLGLKAEQIDSARDLAGLGRPVMIIHGAADDLFPVYHAHKMYQAAQPPKTLWIIEGMGHGNPAVEQPAEFKARVLSFFEQAFAAAAEREEG